MLNTILMWYFIIGLCTVLIGGYRSWKGKNIIVEPDELLVLSWFWLWPFFLPRLIIVWIGKQIKKLL